MPQQRYHTSNTPYLILITDSPSKLCTQFIHQNPLHKHPIQDPIIISLSAIYQSPSFVSFICLSFILSNINHIKTLSSLLAQVGANFKLYD